MARSRKTRTGRPRKPRPVSLPKFNGDHGTGTAAATRNTEVVELKGEDGSNPNRIARRERVNIAERMMQRRLLTTRQYQAADAIQRAYGAVQMLSSGGALKEQVDASPKPDAVIAHQVDANSRLMDIMAAVPKASRTVVEHVCFLNQPVTQLVKGKAGVRAYAKLREALGLVADRIGY